MGCHTLQLFLADEQKACSTSPFVSDESEPVSVREPCHSDMSHVNIGENIEFIEVEFKSRCAVPNWIPLF